VSFGDWRDDLRQASYQGVEFCVSSDEATCGRRTVRHEYIGRDYPYIEDLGKAAREFSVEAIIVGPDYAEKRNKLMRACERPGPGILVHPYYGRVVATLVDIARFEHNKDVGASCSCALRFVRTDPVAISVPVSDELTETVSAAGRALDAINAGFQKAFDIASQASYVVDAARSKVSAAITAINGIKNQARKLSQFTQKIGQLTADINTLMLAPGDLVHSIHEVLCFDFGGGNLTNPYNLQAKLSDFYELSTLFTFGDDDGIPAGTAPSTVKEISNQAAIKDLIQTSAVIFAARTVVDINFASQNDAVLVRDIVIDKMDSIMESTTDDDLYVSLLSLKSAFVKNIEARAMVLSKLQSYTPIASINSLTLAYQLYGDLSNEQDIIDRNRIQNPAFIPGGVALEVLGV
jgi:prophage DNA circulation protein